MEINYPTGKIQLLIHLNISIESTVARIEINWRLLIKMSPLEIQERFQECYMVCSGYLPSLQDPSKMK